MDLMTRRSPLRNLLINDLYPERSKSLPLFLSQKICDGSMPNAAKAYPELTAPSNLHKFLLVVGKDGEVREAYAA